MGTSAVQQLERYDAVIFFESAAVGEMSIEGGNPTRIEGLKEAVALDHALRKIWSQHPRFTLVPHASSFYKKVTFGLAAMESLMAQLDNESSPT